MNIKTDIDMTQGSLLGKILMFSLPLMISNILQLLFNAADVVVVGRFAGHTSLAAVGSTVCIINLFINLLIGISVGVNLVIAQYIGMKNHEREISLALHTAVLVAIVGGTILGVVGIISSEWMLEFISSPLDVRPLALVYIRIYFIGTPFVMLFNYGAAALRAKGDTKRPLLFLFISGVFNVVLNLIFVIFLHLDVAGVALATILSQGLSAGLILFCLTKSKDELCFSWRHLTLDKPSLTVMARIGIPAGVQGCLFSLSNIVIQGAINSYDSVVVAGSSAAASIESFLYVSMNSFHHAGQTFTSQNIGAGRYDRIKKILGTCIMCTVILGIIQSIFVMGFSKLLVSIYNDNYAVIQAGSERLRIIAGLYVIFGIADVLVGVIRGYGAPIAPVIINLLGTCVFRLIWISLLDTSTVDVKWVYVSYPISWGIILIALSFFWIWLRYRDRNIENKKISKG